MLRGMSERRVPGGGFVCQFKDDERGAGFNGVRSILSSHLHSDFRPRKTKGKVSAEPALVAE